jgi:putative ABC transport system substrate-binding protein
MKNTRISRLLAIFTVLSLNAAVFPVPGFSQGEPHQRIALVETFDVPIVLEHTKFFMDAMTKLGYSKESIDIIKGRGDRKKTDRFLDEYIRQNRPSIIVSNATIASQAARAASEKYNLPVVFFVVSDPVGSGIVSKIDEPAGALITGVVHSVPRSTKLEMVMRVLKPLQRGNSPIRFGYIHSSYPSAKGDLKMLVHASEKRGDARFIPYEIPYDDRHFSIRKTLASMKSGIEKLDPVIDFWWVSQDPVGELGEFLKILSKHSKHPVACGTSPESIKLGALMYIAADTEEGARETAEMTDMILRGTPAGSIPVHPPAKIDYGVNLSTARKMGVAIPSDLLELAGPNIAGERKDL